MRLQNSRAGRNFDSEHLGSGGAAQAPQSHVGGHRFTALSLRQRLDKFSFELRRNVEGLFFLASEHGDDHAFWQRLAIDDNSSTYNGSSRELHVPDATPAAAPMARGAMLRR